MTEKITKRQYEAAMLFREALDGNRRAQDKFFEAITTSDLPSQLTPSLNKIMLAEYANYSPVWNQYASRMVLDDFRATDIVGLTFNTDDIERVSNGETYIDNTLPSIGELGAYPTIAFAATGVQVRLGKSGARFELSWETIVNTRDIGLIERSLREFVRYAQNTEGVQAAKQLVTASGINTTNLTNGLASNPVLTMDNLEAAFDTLGQLTTPDGKPIPYYNRYKLVVPPALELTARKIQAVQEIHDPSTGYVTGNPVSSRFDIVVDPYIKMVNTNAAANNYWFLIPDPNAAQRPSVVMAFLRGNEVPELSVKAADRLSPSGTRIPGTSGSFDNDSFATRVRHTATGAFVQDDAIVYSTGAGA